MSTEEAKKILCGANQNHASVMITIPKTVPREERFLLDLGGKLMFVGENEIRERSLF
jgi:hypothetical protein